MDKPWWIYILACDERLYTGITTDIERRLREHRAGGRSAARSTRGAQRVSLRYSVVVGNRSAAQRAEHRIKRLSRNEKLTLIEDAPSADELAARLELQ